MAKVCRQRKGKSWSNFPLRATFFADILVLWSHIDLVSGCCSHRFFLGESAAACSAADLKTIRPPK